jgi:hypothetical protein
MATSYNLVFDPSGADKKDAGSVFGGILESNEDANWRLPTRYSQYPRISAATIVNLLFTDIFYFDECTAV